mgnify:CR=1 FL=1
MSEALVKIMVEEINTCLLKSALELEMSCDEKFTPKERDWHDEKWLKFESQARILRKCLRKYGVYPEIVYLKTVYEGYEFEVKQYKVP